MLVAVPVYAENETGAMSVLDITSGIEEPMDNNEEIETQSAAEITISETMQEQVQPTGRKPIHTLRIHRMHMHFQKKLRKMESFIS